MKSISTKIALILLSASLVACTSNTQRENTAVGSVTGAVVGGLAGSAIGAGTGQLVAIGVGAVAGALIGGDVGSRMDSSDNQRVNNAMNNPTNTRTTWHNPKTGARYSLAPTSQTLSYKGYSTCRKYHSSGSYNGNVRHTDGIACQQSNGAWVPVS